MRLRVKDRVTLPASVSPMGQCPGVKLRKFDNSLARFIHVILAPLIAFPSATVCLIPQPWLHLSHQALPWTNEIRTLPRAFMCSWD